jgi:hypothetical protein
MRYPSRKAPGDKEDGEKRHMLAKYRPMATSVFNHAHAAMPPSPALLKAETPECLLAI